MNEPRPADDALFHALFDAYPDALLLVGADGRIRIANPAAAALLGYADGELAGEPVERLVPDPVRESHTAYRRAYAVRPHARPMGTTQTELVARRRDGSTVQVEIALSPLAGTSLVVAAIRGVADYPRVKQALRRVRYAEQVALVGRLAADAHDAAPLFERLPALAAEALDADAAVLWMVDADGHTLRVVGRHGEAAEPLGERFVPGDVPLPVGGESRVVDEPPEPVPPLLPRAALAAGLRSALGAPVAGQGRSIGLLVVRARAPGRFGADERRAVESLASLLAATGQRMQSEAALRHAQRLETVGQLTGGIAHDFNNLLTVIQGNLQVLDELPELQQGAGREFVAAALRASRRGAELTAQLLAFSRRQALQPGRVDVAALLLALADMLRRTLDQRIRIEVDVAPGCPPVHADPAQLETALLNIAVNARDAMPDGGRLAFRAAPAGESVEIAVADTGVGMNDEVSARAFEPFFTTKEAGRGTGLGLATVYGFVTQSNGAIALDSAPGRGTTLTLSIPRWHDTPVAAVAAAVAPAALPAGLHVLLVEDEPEVRRVVEAFLGALGCRVTACPAAEPALGVLGTGGIDLLLSDIALGAGMRGTELARIAAERFPHLPVLLMSGYAGESAGDAAAREVLRKPFDRAALGQSLARCLSRRAAGAPGEPRRSPT